MRSIGAATSRRGSSLRCSVRRFAPRSGRCVSPSKTSETGAPPCWRLHGQCRLRVIRYGHPSGKFSHVRCDDAESGSQFRALAATRRAVAVDDPAVGVIQALKPESRIMRYDLNDFEWTAIKPMLPNRPRGVRRAKDRRMLNLIFWVLRS